MYIRGIAGEDRGERAGRGDERRRERGAEVLQRRGGRPEGKGSVGRAPAGRGQQIQLLVENAKSTTHGESDKRTEERHSERRHKTMRHGVVIKIPARTET